MTIAIRNVDVSRRSFMVGAAGLTFAVATGLRPATVGCYWLRH